MREMTCRRWVARMMPLIVAAGCEAQAPEPAEPITEVQSALTVLLTIPVPLGLNPTDVALGAKGQLFVNDRAQVREQASATDLALISNAGTAAGSTTNVGVSAQVGTINSIPRVVLRNNSLVRGSVYEAPAGGPQTQGPFTVTGFISQDALPSMVSDVAWSRSVTWPTNVKPSVSLEPGQTPPVVMLTPDAYHSVAVKSGRVLQLQTGTYYFDSLSVEPQGGLRINGQAGPVYVFVNGPVTFRGNMDGSVATPGMPIASLTIMTTGSAAIQSSPTAALFNGVVIANGSISLSAGIIRGAFFANNITLFEDGRLFHVRDPFSFRGFGASDRVSVTGGSIRLGEDVTDEFSQSETVSVVSKVGQQFIVTVGYNDKTTGVTNPEVTYPNGRTANKRVVRRGTSLLGWSYSTDGGYTFNYGGRVRPPTGWSAIWSDPGMAKVSIDDPNIYYAQMAVSDASFSSQPFNPTTGSGYDPATDTIQNLTPNVDSYCVAKSTDRGVTFPSVGCVTIPPNGFGIDGTALAAATNNAGVQEVYLSFNSGNVFPVWRMNGQSLTFTQIASVPPPAGAGGFRLHPRLRVLNGVLYLVAVDTANRVFGATLDARNSATTWQPSVVLATGVATENGWGGARAVSFDTGSDGSGNTRFRIMYIVDDGATGSALATRECNVDLSNCHDLPWNTRGVAGNESQPSLRSGGGALWGATWMGQPGGLGGLNVIGARLRALIIPPIQNDLETIILSPAVVPCSFTGSGYWGDYNEIDSYGDSRFFAAYTTNGPGCRYRGPLLSDQHVGGSVFRF